MPPPQYRLSGWRCWKLTTAASAGRRVSSRRYQFVHQASRSGRSGRRSRPCGSGRGCTPGPGPRHRGGSGRSRLRGSRPPACSKWRLKPVQPSTSMSSSLSSTRGSRSSMSLLQQRDAPLGRLLGRERGEHQAARPPSGPTRSAASHRSTRSSSSSSSARRCFSRSAPSSGTWSCRQTSPAVRATAPGGSGRSRGRRNGGWSPARRRRPAGPPRSSQSTHSSK